MMKKSILFLIPTLGGGGAERVLVNLVNNLDKGKYDITIQTLFKAGTNAQYLNEDIHFIEGKVKQFRGNIHFMKLFSPQLLYRFLIRKHYDIVVSYLEGPTARIVSGCKDIDTKKICWIHVEQNIPQKAARSFRSVKEAEKCYNRYNKIICVAETVKQDFMSLFPIKCPCEVIYNVNEDQKIKSASNELVDDVTFSNEINVVTMGRVVEEKGFDRLVRIHEKLLELGTSHHIYHIGGGNVAGLQSLVNQMKVNDTFHLVGFKTNPYKYIKKADLFVCSSKREGFSTSVTEALILGIPVISTEVSGAKELLGDFNQYGIVTNNDEISLLEGLKTMLTTPDLLLHYKQQAQLRGQQFSKEHCIHCVEELF